MWWTPDSRHSLDSEISDRTASRKFIRPQGRKILEELWNRPTKTADLGTSLWQFTSSNNICLLEDKIQNWGMYLFTISNGSYALKSSRSIKGTHGPDLSCSTRELLQHWTKSSRIPASRKRSVWRKCKLTKKTVSFEEDRLLTCSTSISGSLEPTILSRIMPTCLQMFFEMIVRNSIRNGTEFYCRWHKSHLMTSWKILYKLRICVSDKLKTVLKLYNMEIHQKKAGPTITDWRQWWKEVSSRIYESRILKPEMENLKQTPWSRIRGQNRWTKKSRILLAMESWRAVFERRQLQFPARYL